MRILGRLVLWTLAVAGAVALLTAAWLTAGGVSTRPAPGHIETSAARALRSWAIPAMARSRTNPEPQTLETLRSGLEHFADHCAGCHANDGSGDVVLGRAMYPPVPDMRAPATQDLSDGELFYIIEEGVRFTGMPAWGTGTPEGARASWHLVQFVRHLPRLRPEEIESMRELNPRSAAEWRALDEERRFLEGDEGVPSSPPTSHGHGSGGHE